MVLVLSLASLARAKDWVVYRGTHGPGLGKRIVFLTGDEEYRSEEGLPMLARILAYRHGFTCTVLFSIGPAGTINPNVETNIPGMEALDSADLCIMLLRFRELPDAQMKHFVDYLNAGKPIIALRTSTHAFAYQRNPHDRYARFGWQSKTWPGGFGRQVLGETWVSHHGAHGREATRGVIMPSARNNPILRGVTNLFVTTDVYTANPPPDVQILVRGEVVAGLKPTDPPVAGPKNHPMQPIVWVRAYHDAGGHTNRIFTTTMGAATDLQCADLRRLIVNAAYWAVGLQDRIPARADVDYVGEYHPSPFAFGGFKRGVRPEDLDWNGGTDETKTTGHGRGDSAR